MAGSNILDKEIVRNLRKEVSSLKSRLEIKQAELLVSQVSLTEARRRTIPVSGGKETVNFLPAFVKSIKQMDRDRKNVFGIDGTPIHVHGPIEMEIVVMGELVYSKS